MTIDAMQNFFLVVFGIAVTVGLIIYFVERAFNKNPIEDDVPYVDHVGYIHMQDLVGSNTSNNVFVENKWDPPGFAEATDHAAAEICKSEDERIKKQVKKIFKKRPSKKSPKRKLK